MMESLLLHGKLIRVDNVELTITRNVHTGANRGITGTLRFANATSGRFNDLIGYVRNSPSVTFPLGAFGVRTTTSDDADLNDFMYQFLTTGDAVALALYNGESSNNAWTSRNGQKGSANYCGTSDVYIKVWMTYQQ